MPREYARQIKPHLNPSAADYSQSQKRTPIPEPAEEVSLDVRPIRRLRAGSPTCGCRRPRCVVATRRRSANSLTNTSCSPTCPASNPAPSPSPRSEHVDNHRGRRDRLHAGGLPFRLERPTGKPRRSHRSPAPTSPPRSARRLATVCSRSASPTETTLDSPRSSESRSNRTSTGAPARSGSVVRRQPQSAEVAKVAPARKTRRAATTRGTREPAPLP
jgi:hypothetical protein